MRSALSESQVVESEDSTANPDETLEDSSLQFEFGTGFDEEDIITSHDIIDTDEGDLEDLFLSIDAFSLPFLSEGANENLRIVVRSQTEANFNRIVEDPAEFFLGTLEYITFFILMMIPVLALIQKIFYIRSGRFYVEHLVLALHNHAFIILSFFLLILSDFVAEWEIAFLSAGFDYLGLGVMIWIVAYLFLSLKNFFQQGKFVTVLKFLLASFVYILCLSTGILFFGILLFFLF